MFIDLKAINFSTFFERFLAKRELLTGHLKQPFRTNRKMLTYNSWFVVKTD